jgi:aspartyl-tRNA(Asn)/glutamyl-tRNA(Gln) amidotransferase subunit A
MSATDALAAFAARTLSPVEVLDALAARADEVEPTINAFAETRWEEALAAARAAERRWAGRGEAPRPLEGVAVAAKEVLPLAGHRVTQGLDLLADGPVATRSAWIVERVEAAGGIVHARTTTSELCCMPVSHAVRWGVTRNPWDPATSPGGSSGGSAAALAAGTTTLALGTDLGGSIRVPAALTGTVGLKAPYGRIPLEPPGNLDTWSHVGPLARTVPDAALLADVLAGPHPLDVASLPAAPPLGAPAADASGLRIGVAARPGDLPVDDEVAEATLRAGDALRAAGAAVEEVDLSWRLDDVKAAMWGRAGVERAQALLEATACRADAISPYTRECLARTVALGPTRTTEERAGIEARIHAVLARAFATCDAVVIPTFGTRTLAAGEDWVDRPLVAGGRPLEHFCDAALTPVFNVSSRCPVVAVPAPGGPPGAPAGVQIASRPYDDATALRVAAALEAASPPRSLCTSARSAVD